MILVNYTKNISFLNLKICIFKAVLYVRIRKRNEFVCHAKIRLMKKLKRKEYKTNKWNITRNSKFWLVLSIGIIGILGVLILKYGTASTYSISLETENGLKSNIVDCQDSQASQFVS